MLKENKGPYNATKKGEKEVVVQNVETFEKEEQLLKLRTKVMKAEQERLDGEQTLSVEEARRRLRDRAKNV